MSLNCSCLSICLFVISSVAASAAPSQETLAREYEQVRKIALRDPKVRAAYDAADQRLDDKIVKIDPALTSYVKSRRGTAPSSAEKPASTAKPAAAAKPAHAHKPNAVPRRDISHVVAHGDTLSSIASKYSVSVDAIRKANRIADERKLPIGQTLTIPVGSPRATH